MADRNVRMPRSVRRHHRARLYSKRKKHWNLYSSYNDHVDPHKYAVMRGMLVDTPTLCSCYGCGNPRKYKIGPMQGRTLQEIRCINSYQLDVLEDLKGVLKMVRWQEEVTVFR